MLDIYSEDTEGLTVMNQPNNMELTELNEDEIENHLITMFMDDIVKPLEF